MYFIDLAYFPVQTSSRVGFVTGDGERLPPEDSNHQPCCPEPTAGPPARVAAFFGKPCSREATAGAFGAGSATMLFHTWTLIRRGRQARAKNDLSFINRPPGGRGWPRVPPSSAKWVPSICMYLVYAQEMEKLYGSRRRRCRRGTHRSVTVIRPVLAIG